MEPPWVVPYLTAHNSITRRVSVVNNGTCGTSSVAVRDELLRLHPLRHSKRDAVRPVLHVYRRGLRPSTRLTTNMPFIM